MPANLLELSHIHKQAALYLAQGYTYTQISTQLDISITTLQQWNRTKLFREQLDLYKQEIASEEEDYARHKQRVLQSTAIDTVEYLLKNAESEAVRGSMARYILDNGVNKAIRRENGGELPQGTVLLHEKMLIAMHRVSEIQGDTQMAGMMSQFLATQPPSVTDNGVVEGEVIESEEGNDPDGGVNAS